MGIRVYVSRMLDFIANRLLDYAVNRMLGIHAEAANDQGHRYSGGRLGDGGIAQLPSGAQPGLDSVRLIDVIWVEADGTKIAAAFEVEHSTSIYSGIVRMLDLALGTELGAGVSMLLVAPDARREDVRTQLRRPAFSRVAERAFVSAF